LLKALIVGVLFLLFAGNTPSYSIFTRELWIETAMNTVAAPALFAFLKLFRSVLMPEKEQ
jgi:rod shape-determining protein MreD